MASKRHTEEFKIEAVKQVTDRRYSVAEVTERLGMTTHGLDAWVKRYGESNPRQANTIDYQAEAVKKAYLYWVTGLLGHWVSEECVILKKAAA